jgi:hypothetical protein
MSLNTARRTGAGGSNTAALAFGGTTTGTTVRGK